MPRFAERWVASAIAVLMGGAYACATDLQIQKVVASGDVDAATGFTFNLFEPPTINSVGEVALIGRLGDAPPSGDSGIWSGTPGSLKNRMLEGGVVPFDAAGVTWDEPRQRPVISNGGRIQWVGGTSLRVGYYVTTDSGFGRLLDTRSGAPNTPLGGTATIGGTKQWAGMTRSGLPYFHADLSGGPFDSSADQGIWAGDPGVSQCVVSTRMLAPDTSPSLEYMRLGRVSVNDYASVAYFGSADFGNSDAGVWVGPAGAIRRAAREGDPAPTLPAGTIISGFADRVVCNNAGQVAFSAVFRNRPNWRFAEGGALWVGTPDTLRPVASRGQVVPGSGGTLTLVEPSSVLFALGGDGTLAFRSSLGDASGNLLSDNRDAAILSAAASGELRLLAKEGDTVPGSASIEFRDFLEPTVNASGQIAFLGLLTSGVDTSLTGIFATDPISGELVKVVMTGDVLDVNGAVRTVRRVSMAGNSGGQDGFACSFNDAGQLAFHARFMDGTEGVFIAAIPTPGGGAAVVMGFTLFTFRRRREGAVGNQTVA